MGPITRRLFLRGSAGAAGVALAASRPARAFAEQLGGDVRAVLGPPPPISTDARTIEGGLATFVAKWEIAAPIVFLTRFGRFLSNKIFNCRVGSGDGSTDPRSYVLDLGAAGAAMAPGVDPYAHADIVMEEADWLAVLFGDYTGLAPILSGRAHPSRDDANKVTLVGILMFVFAHIPAGPGFDPDLAVRIVQQMIARGGLPDCPGQPPLAEVLDDLGRDGAGEVNAAAFPPTRAVPVTRTLADWMAGVSFDEIPEGALQSAREQLTGTLGAIYAGSTMGPGRKAVRAVREWAEAGPCTGLGAQRLATSARNAAMLNSYLAQILEWDDWTYLAHSGAAIVPVALAVGEMTGASGREVLTSIVAANEVIARAGDVLTDVINTGQALAVHQIETTLVAGRLLGLDADGIADAVGIACTQPQMTSIAAWTAESKGLVTGWPVHTAVTAALFARAGMTGNRGIIESALGYSRVADIGSPRRLEKMVRGLGTVWQFDAAANKLFTKRYPTNGFHLTAVEAILALRRGPLAGIARAQLPGAVERIEMRIPLVMAATASMFSQGPAGRQALLDRVADPAQPDWTYIALLYDGVWPVAAALADGELTHRQYADEKLTDPVIRALVDKVVEIADVTMGVFGTTARVQLASGEVYEEFRRCIDDFDATEKLAIGAEAAGVNPGPIIDAIGRLETFTDVREFTKLL